MKKLLNLALALLLPAAFCLPAAAQPEYSSETLSDDGASGGEGGAAAKPAEKKPAAKKAPAKKAKKKKKAEPVSEYRFEAVDKTPTYTFDKEAVPITEEKKKAAKKAAKKPSKKAIKKPAKKVESEYKFDAVDRTPSYKMDKYADPIIKEPKKKKKAAAKKPAEEPKEGWGGEASGAVPEGN